MSSEGPSALDPMLRKLQRRAPFDPADREALLALPHDVRTIEPGRYVVREGDAPTHCCAILSGFACRHKLVSDGSRSIGAVHMKGDIADLQNSLLGRADHNVQTLTRSEIAFIPREAIRLLAAAKPAIGIAMWHDTLIDGSILREWIANLARRDAATRLAHLLCEFAIRIEHVGIGDRFRFELPMTQEQLADATGLTPVHVNRTLRDLEQRGLISRNVRTVAIADWDRIREAADFNAAYLHLPDEVAVTNHEDRP